MQSCLDGEQAGVLVPRSAFWGSVRWPCAIHQDYGLVVHHSSSPWGQIGCCFGLCKRSEKSGLCGREGINTSGGLASNLVIAFSHRCVVNKFLPTEEMKFCYLFLCRVVAPIQFGRLYAVTRRRNLNVLNKCLQSNLFNKTSFIKNVSSSNSGGDVFYVFVF